MEAAGNKDTAIWYYYKAAIQSAAGETESALESLDSSLELGFRDFAVLQASPYFARLRDDSRYQSLLAHYQE